MKKIAMLLILFLLVGCENAKLDNKKLEKSATLIGEWKSDDGFTVEILNSDSDKVYELKFNDELNDVSNLDTDDAVLSSINNKQYVFKSEKTKLGYSFNFEDSKQAMFMFYTTEDGAVGTSSPIKIVEKTS